MLRLAPQRIRALVLLASSADPAGPTQAERWQAQQSQWQQIGPRALAQAMSQQASPRLSDQRSSSWYKTWLKVPLKLLFSLKANSMPHVRVAFMCCPNALPRCV